MIMEKRKEPERKPRPLNALGDDSQSYDDKDWREPVSGNTLEQDPGRRTNTRESESPSTMKPLGLGKYERQLRRAYGDRYPGSHQRWLAKQAERDSIEQGWITKQAWALYRRVHGEPCQGELDRLEFEREVKAKNQALARGRTARPKEEAGR
jgi:hypothetical protein